MNYQRVMLFYIAMHQLIVHSGDMNPLDYTTSTIKGHGVHIDNLSRAYAKSIRKGLKIKREVQEPHWPFKPDEVMEKLNIEPIKELCNLVYPNIDPCYKQTSMAML